VYNFISIPLFSSYGPAFKESSRPISSDITGRGLFSLFAAWFACGTTILRPYISSLQPLIEPDVRFSPVLVPICSDHIMFAQDLCHSQIVNISISMHRSRARLRARSWNYIDFNKKRQSDLSAVLTMAGGSDTIIPIASGAL